MSLANPKKYMTLLLTICLINGSCPKHFLHNYSNLSIKSKQHLLCLFWTNNNLVWSVFRHLQNEKKIKLEENDIEEKMEIEEKLDMEKKTDIGNSR